MNLFDFMRFKPDRFSFEPQNAAFFSIFSERERMCYVECSAYWVFDFVGLGCHPVISFVAST